MNERLLHFIWQFRYFNNRHLVAENGEQVEVVFPGHPNFHQGPDFLEAKIKIGNTLLAGSVELHIKASGWHLHKHHLDKNYNNVILHVVWENDKPASIRQQFQTLVLQPYVPAMMLEKYASLMRQKSFVPCQHYLPALPQMAWLNWKERMITERLERRSAEIIALLQENNMHWEETFWQLIARNFGMKINAEIFFEMAKRISINILAKHKYQIHQIEALLFGTANLLPATSGDDYVKILIREYDFLAKKFGLQKTSASPLFLRMRPANFPSVRLAQLAQLIHHSNHLFSKIKEAGELAEVKKLFEVTANDYWHYHYRLGDEASDYFPKNLGASMIDNILINTVAPVLFSFGIFNRLQEYKDKALQWLQEIPPENNAVIKSWRGFGVPAANALESQALLELKKNYCDVKKCLDCNAGKTIVSAHTPSP